MKQPIRHFALGVLTATIILAFQYIYFNTEDDVKLEKSEPSEQEMIDALEQLGYFISLEEPIYNESTEATSDNEADSENDQGISSADIYQFTLTIRPGMTITQVADFLIMANLIDSHEQFADYLAENGYDRNIQIGQFQLASDMSLDEIVETIAVRE
ncbi:hypothetical protein [Amphibacillus sediminis]|uniref:hypothetical protein n=1 Tax=Amphibacillus sediminis TaxID=360185 RepID=UPI0008343D67|nr:hypothetical protein [Amphibacillus sediminis]